MDVGGGSFNNFLRVIMIKISSRFGRATYESEKPTLREAVEEAASNRANLSDADLSKANLSDADLSGANLSRANLSRANLFRANLSGANLSDADLSGANLSDADLSGANLSDADLSDADLSRANLFRANLFKANLSDANLSGARINWNSHAIIAELLRQAAGDSVSRRMVVGLVAVSIDWCWSQFSAIEHDERAWAIATLTRYVQPGDGAPDILTANVKREESC